ncbi:ATP-binding cassette domain-containing protein [Candidatus Enterococcus clewellii]|uniref:ABC-2 type transport system ATP-binding protein n=1 Tax=Candidatus Enterococcus clewellii TaxID=1834193 RepID=A0A242K936_9ENTE|nr:ATP-binding cassette domain-containing protein [Enterococcus sp. 9E7_DIV0242]OTP17681.1 hypothetical protein A5888_001819 [Enterococcus sp. 9E7_DIV0242]
MHTILAAETIKKNFGKRPILDGVTLHVKRGDIYGLIGKNGSGKTTLLSVLSGLICDYEGKISIRKSGTRITKISAVIKDPALFLNMSAVDNMKEQAYLLGVKNEVEIQRVLTMVGLDSRNRDPVRTFSLGMTQRMKLALALLEQPDILILDEPTNGLDPDGIADMRELLLDLNQSKGTTILISSHILSELEQLATRFGILHDGKIVKEISEQELSQTGDTLEKLYLHYTRRHEDDPNY